MREDILEEIGLTKTETKVYLALLELGSSSTGHIVEKSKASSSKIYEILEKLMQKGLVSFIVKSGIKYFEAAPPERIMDYMKEKETEFSRQKDELTKILPELELRQKLSKYKSEATIFKGIKGGETAFRQMINAMKKDDEWIGFVVSFANEQYFDLLTKLHTWRAKKGIRSRVIMNEKHKDQGEIREKLPNTTVKYVSDEMQTPAIINVAGNITLLNIMAEDVTVFMIDNKDVADSFRNQFEKLWNQRVYTYQGVEQIKDLIRQTLDFGDYEVFAEGMKIIDVLGRDFFLWWQNEKKKRHIKSRGIMGEKYMDMPTVRDSTTQFRFLPEFENPGLVFVFNDKVANVILSKDPVAFLIDNKDVADNQRNYFDLLWNESTRTYKGYDAFKRVWRESLDMGDTLYWIGAKGYFFDNRLKDAMEIVDIARKKGMRWKNVVDESTRGHAITKLDIVETRYFKEKITAPGVFWIIGSRIMISNWAKEEPILVVIDNKEIADSYKNYFDILWKMAKA